jgi:hypothetical protein
MRRAIIVLAALVVVGAGVLVYVLTRPSADLDGPGSYATRGFGTKPETRKSGPARRYSGTGTVIAAFSATNRRDHDVKLSVPKKTREQLARSGVRAEVLFLPLTRDRGYGAYRSEADLKRGSTTMPAKADGEIVHVFRVDRCGANFSPTFALDVDGHTARVDVAVTSDHYELWTWDRDVTDAFGNLQIGGCG